MEFVKRNGYDGDAPDLNKILGAQRELQRMLGAGNPDKLARLPDNPADIAALKETGILKKLGAPEAPDGYKFDRPELPDGMNWDSDLEGAILQAGVDGGILPGQMQMLIGKFGGVMAERFQSQAADEAARAAAFDQELTQRWGDKRPQMEARLQQTAAQLGIDRQSIDPIMKGLGDMGSIALFEKLADAMENGELRMPGAGANPLAGGVMTPARAQQTIEDRRADKDFMAAISDRGHPKHKANNDELNRLYEIAEQK